MRMGCKNRRHGLQRCGAEQSEPANLIGVNCSKDGWHIHKLASGSTTRDPVSGDGKNGEGKEKVCLGSCFGGLNGNINTANIIILQSLCAEATLELLQFPCEVTQQL